VVLGENISQTAQFVQSGSADAAILALSLVLSPGMKNQGRYFDIPQELYPPLCQAAVILRSSQHQEAARRFIEFMKTSEIKTLLKQYGFALEETI
jgi:molybdate transport system substrate-binding protein